MLRFYHIKDGSEKVTAFWFAGEFLSNYGSFLTHQASDHHIQAATAGAYWGLKRNELYQL